jgi:hypothetical protein
MFTGTVFTDTSAVARLYDQDQMAHAVSASSSPARTTPEVSEPWRLYQWWYGTQPESPKTMLYWGPVVQMLFLGIHMAGPHLSAETFAGGLFDYPPTGGTDLAGLASVDLFLEGYLAGDTTPAISFGPRDDGSVDYVAVDDFTIAWWDSDATGPDESGQEGSGMWQYTGMGLRLPYAAPTPPAGISEDILFETHLSGVGGDLFEAAQAFGVDDIQVADTILDATPPLDAVPSYPPWAESPAAGGPASG